MSAVGIDLGTTFSATSVVAEDGTINLVKNLDGEELTPSFFWVKQNTNNTISFKVGKQAKEMCSIDPTNVISSFKTLMGSGLVAKRLLGVDITPEQCSAKILEYLKESVETATKELITECVITVPAYFNETQKAATEAAAKLAGLPLLRLLHEPTAAAYHYAVIPKNQGEQKIVLAIDLGGGTLDVSLIVIQDDSTQVLATYGDNKLGGDDIDRLLAKHFLRLNKIKKCSDNSLQRLIRWCENVKIHICSNPEHSITDTFKDEEISVTITDFTYDSFESIIVPILGRVKECVEKVFEISGFDFQTIDDTILVGGSTRIPSIHHLVADMSENKFSLDYLANYLVDPDLAVSLGAADYLKSLKDNNKILYDVIAKPIGVEDSNGNMLKIVNAGASYPTTKYQTLTNNEDYCDHIIINLYEGAHTLARQNDLLATLKIPCTPTPKGETTILVTLRIDRNATLKCSATVNGKSVSVKVERKFNVTDIDFNEKKIVKENKPTAKW